MIQTSLLLLSFGMLVVVLTVTQSGSAILKQHSIKEEFDTWYMSPGGDDSGPGTYQDPFRTLARAVEVSRDEDHIVLLKGNYLGPSNCGLTISKKLSIETYEDPKNVILNCNAVNAPGITVGPGGNLSLNRMTITMSKATGFIITVGAWAELVQVNVFSNFGVSGGGIWAQENSTLIIRNSDISFNKAKNGGGIYVAKGAFVEEDNAYAVINSNHADENGGGVFLEPFSKFMWNTGLWNNNSAAIGGGLYATGPNTTVLLADLKVTFNQANYGAGIAIDGGANATLLHLTNQQNKATASGGGGGIFCRQSRISEEGSVLHLNVPNNLFCDNCNWTDTIGKCNCLRCP